jgi:hypothetical protein
VVSQKSKSCGRLYQRKFFYLLTCEYCLSHMSLFGRLRLDIRHGRLKTRKEKRRGRCKLGIEQTRKRSREFPTATYALSYQVGGM